jgi:hypothetical protein
MIDCRATRKRKGGKCETPISATEGTENNLSFFTRLEKNKTCQHASRTGATTIGRSTGVISSVCPRGGSGAAQARRVGAGEAKPNKYGPRLPP